MSDDRSFWGLILTIAYSRAPPETYQDVGPAQAALNLWVWNTTRPFSWCWCCRRRHRQEMPLFIQHGHDSHFTECVNLNTARAAVEEQSASETPAAPDTDGMMSRGLTAQIINRSAADPTLIPSDYQSIDLRVEGAPVNGPGPRAAVVRYHPRADVMTPEGRNTLLGAREYYLPASEGSYAYRVFNLLPGETLVGGSVGESSIRFPHTSLNAIIFKLRALLSSTAHLYTVSPT
ncbi:unnamed protein product [Penicillium viridicatum]